VFRTLFVVGVSIHHSAFRAQSRVPSRASVPISPLKTFSCVTLNDRLVLPSEPEVERPVAEGGDYPVEVELDDLFSPAEELLPSSDVVYHLLEGSQPSSDVVSYLLEELPSSEEYQSEEYQSEEYQSEDHPLEDHPSLENPAEDPAESVLENQAEAEAEDQENPAENPEDLLTLELLPNHY